MVSSLIEQSQGKKSNFGGVTELLCKRRVVAWIDVIVKPVDCCYIIPPSAHRRSHYHTLLVFVEQCCGGSIAQTTSMEHHHCNLLGALHMLVFV